MLRLCSDSSRSYPGRSAPHAFRNLKSAAIGNGCRDGAEVSRGRSRQGRHHSWRCGGWKQARESPGRLTLLKDRTRRGGCHSP